MADQERFRDSLYFIPGEERQRLRRMQEEDILAMSQPLESTGDDSLITYYALPPEKLNEVALKEKIIFQKTIIDFRPNGQVIRTKVPLRPSGPPEETK